MSKKFFSSIGCVLALITGCGSENSVISGPSIDCSFDDMGYTLFAPNFYDYVDSGSYKDQPDGKYTIQIKTKFTKGDYVQEGIERVRYTKLGNIYSPTCETCYGTVNLSELKEINTEGQAKGQCSISSITPRS